MTQEESKRRSEDAHVNYIKEHLCDKTSGKPFVFISYKSDDWEIVLHDVVYRLMKDYGLNVYFDGSFDIHAPIWIEQFPENMNSSNCKGVLAFLDNKYSQSYATLMELMYSQTKKASIGGKRKGTGLPVIPVNLETLRESNDDSDTGLGVEIFPDGSRNPNAGAERETFDRAYQELVKREILEGHWYFVGDRLTRSICESIVSELISYLKVNENPYPEAGSSLDGIVSTIKDVCGEEVFQEGMPDPPVNIRKLGPGTTLKEIEELCEYPDFCLKLREIKKTKEYDAQAFYYLFAALLRGCDEKASKKEKSKEIILHQARWNFCTYVVSKEVDKENPSMGTGQWTWTTACRKAVGLPGSKDLGENSISFSQLSGSLTIGDIRDKFEKETEAAYKTKKNDQILAAVDALLKLDITDIIF